MKQFIYILTGVLLLSACSRSSFEAEKSTVDSLLLAYQKLEAKVESMPTDEAKQHLATYKTSIELIKKNINPNKIPSMESSKFIDAFRSVKTTFRKLPNKQSTLTQHIATNSEQLENLLEDINNYEFKKTVIKNYIKEERAAFNLLQLKYEKTMQMVIIQKEVLDSLNRIIPEKIQELQQ